MTPHCRIGSGWARRGACVDCDPTAQKKPISWGETGFFYGLQAAPSWGAPGSMLGQQGLSLLAFVVDGKAIDQGGTGVVQADDRHLFPLAAELDDHLVEGRDGGDVPEVACVRSMTTFSTSSLKSKPARNCSALAKKTWPRTR